MDTTSKCSSPLPSPFFSIYRVTLHLFDPNLNPRHSLLSSEGSSCSYQTEYCLLQSSKIGKEVEEEEEEDSVKKRSMRE